MNALRKGMNRLRRLWHKQSARRKRQLYGIAAMAAFLLAAAVLSIAFGAALWQGPLSTKSYTLDVPLTAPATATSPAALPSPASFEPPAAAQAEDVIVFIPWSGARYHANATCSGMRDTLAVPLAEAKAQGFSACTRCNPPE